MPVLIRGAHAALSPNFGAPATPVPWQTAHVVSKTFLPSAVFPAPTVRPPTGVAGAPAGAAAGAVALPEGAAAVRGCAAPEFIMYSTARPISTSDSSAIPPRAGIPA